jgi:hypothetical protein
LDLRANPPHLLHKHPPAIGTHYGESRIQALTLAEFNGSRQFRQFFVDQGRQAFDALGLVGANYDFRSERLQ